MYTSILYFVTLIASAVSAQDVLQIHGKDVSKECLAAYRAAFGPEKRRTEAFVALAKAVNEPAELKDRIQKASTALQAYQQVLTTMDDKLSAALNSDEKKQLETAQNDTVDVAPSLKELAKVIKDPAHTPDPALNSAYQAFIDARKAEIDAGHVVETACPQDID